MHDDLSINSFVAKLPKAELHFHFEGAIPWETIKKLHPEGKNFPPIPPFLQNNDSEMAFDEFLLIFQDFIRPCLYSIDNYKAAATAIMKDLSNKGVLYAEWNVSLKVMKDKNIDYLEGFNALQQSIDEFESPNKPVIKFIAGINREYSPEEKLKILDELDSIAAVAGVDMHGYEKSNDLIDCREFFEALHKKNWKIKVHAGEFGGPENVRIAVEDFNIHHICHGVCAAEDDKLIELLANRQTVLELCPTSNRQLGIYGKFKSYPLPKLLRNGVKVTINSDDPLIFNTDIGKEYLMAEKMGLSPSELGSLAMNSIEVSLLSTEKKRSLQKKIIELIIDNCK